MWVGLCVWCRNMASRQMDNLSVPFRVVGLPNEATQQVQCIDPLWHERICGILCTSLHLLGWLCMVSRLSKNCRCTIKQTYPMGCEAQLAWKYVFTSSFWWGILTRKIRQTDPVLVCDQGSLVGLCTQDHKSLRATFTIYATLVNIQTDTPTHTQTDSILTSLYE